MKHRSVAQEVLNKTGQWPEDEHPFSKAQIFEMDTRNPVGDSSTARLKVEFSLQTKLLFIGSEVPKVTTLTSFFWCLLVISELLSVCLALSFGEEEDNFIFDCR